MIFFPSAGHLQPNYLTRIPPRDPPQARPTSVSPHETRDYAKSWTAAESPANPFSDRNASYHDIADPSDTRHGLGAARDSRYDQNARGMLFNADDLEGDLGYAAAEELERRATRKVIVERLETVQSKNPVFTWC
ncbi:phosphatidyl inositol kinase [Ascosphaera pollenicola]|nr:phosphatidyl inositol kinase [Ascosphaera pollenicola]